MTTLLSQLNGKFNRAHWLPYFLLRCQLLAQEREFRVLAFTANDVCVGIINESLLYLNGTKDIDADTPFEDFADALPELTRVQWGQLLRQDLAAASQVPELAEESSLLERNDLLYVIVAEPGVRAHLLELDTNNEA